MTIAVADRTLGSNLDSRELRLMGAYTDKSKKQQRFNLTEMLINRRLTG